MTTWNIDTTHSAINFTARHMVFAKVRGRFASWKGSVALDEKDLARSSVEVSIDTGSIDTGVADRDNHLRSADFFEVERFPSASFKSTRIEKSGPNYKIYGELKIRDVSREVVLDAEDLGRGKDPWGNERVGFNAKTSINRLDYGLKWNQLLESGGVLVGEKIELEIEIQAVKAA